MTHKLPLTLLKVKCTPYTYYNYPESQISLRFALQPAVFQLLVIWDKCTEWPQNYLKH